MKVSKIPLIVRLNGTDTNTLSIDLRRDVYDIYQGRCLIKLIQFRCGANNTADTIFLHLDSNRQVESADMTNQYSLIEMIPIPTPAGVPDPVIVYSPHHSNPDSMISLSNTQMTFTIRKADATLRVGNTLGITDIIVQLYKIIDE